MGGGAGPSNPAGSAPDFLPTKLCQDTHVNPSKFQKNMKTKNVTSIVSTFPEIRHGAFSFFSHC